MIETNLLQHGKLTTMQQVPHCSMYFKSAFKCARFSQGSQDALTVDTGFSYPKL
uniref:Uncharacterized protein n=1 Tax=Rhizophora mucronata TaxID=61149 RepID=A0A2P2IIX1_RHIMU